MKKAVFITHPELKPVVYEHPWHKQGRVFNNKSLDLPPENGLLTLLTFFDCKKPVKKATVTATALGVFDLTLNNQRVGVNTPDGRVFDELKPGWTDYRCRVFQFTYDITDMMELVDGKAVLKDIYLPAGKKPLVISIDDVNYYNYMLDDGFASRLDVDDQGNVVTIMGGTIIDHGEKVLTVEGGEPTYDGDVMPILDAYVKEHPEFSWQGAKGIVAITGYAGAFGYRITDLHLFDEQTQQWMLDKTKEVAQALRNTGWQIACHSYTHNQYWNKKTITMEEEQYDIGRWLGEIAPYVGDTNIFISPFGVSFDGDDQRFRYLVDNGFWIYCPVDSYQPCYVREDYMIQGRINLDGLTMKRYPERISRHFFDPTPILDPARPD